MATIWKSKKKGLSILSPKSLEFSFSVENKSWKRKRALIFSLLSKERPNSVELANFHSLLKTKTAWSSHNGHGTILSNKACPTTWVLLEQKNTLRKLNLTFEFRTDALLEEPKKSNGNHLTVFFFQFLRVALTKKLLLKKKTRARTSSEKSSGFSCFSQKKLQRNVLVCSKSEQNLWEQFFKFAWFRSSHSNFLQLKAENCYWFLFPVQ